MNESRFRIGVANEETWRFFADIHEDLKRHYEVSVFKRRQVHWPIFNTRINRYRFNRDMKVFLASNDLVFFEWASGLLADATRLPKTCRVVTRLHRYELYEWADRINWDRVDRVIFVSQATQREFNDRFPDHATKTRVIASSASMTRYHFSPRDYRGNLGILCHLTPRKRVYDLILTVAEMLQEGDDFHLHIGGGDHPSFGDYSKALRTIVEKLRLEDLVTFYGHVEDTPKWLGNIDVFISHSYSEGLQAAPIEAMATGCYTLVHGWQGAEELVPGDCIYYTAKELKRKLRAYASSSADEKSTQQRRMRSVAREKFDVDEKKVEIRELIDELCSNDHEMAPP